ncbi:MAG: DinB family protein [Candidatus Acidiferrales bacterium]|jgi:hypothetical protein
MKSLLRIAVASVFALFLAGLLAAQEAAKKVEPPKPAPSPSAALLETWNYQGHKLIAMAEDFPEDKYDFKPNPAQRTFAEQLLHAAGANYYLINAAEGKKMGEENLPRDKYKTKAEVVAALKNSFEEGAALIKAKGDAGMAAEVKNPFGNSMIRLSDFAYGILIHAGEHYGQLVVYYRVNNMVPPESRPRK